MYIDAWAAAEQSVAGPCSMILESLLILVTGPCACRRWWPVDPVARLIDALKRITADLSADNSSERSI